MNLDFVPIAVWASYQQIDDTAPDWRTLKANGELNAEHLSSVEARKEKLKAGDTI